MLFHIFYIKPAIKVLKRETWYCDVHCLYNWCIYYMKHDSIFFFCNTMSIVYTMDVLQASPYIILFILGLTSFLTVFYWSKMKKVLNYRTYRTQRMYMEYGKMDYASSAIDATPTSLAQLDSIQKRAKRVIDLSTHEYEDHRTSCIKMIGIGVFDISWKILKITLL